MTLKDWIRRARYRLALRLLDAEPDQPKPMQWTPEAVGHFWTAFSKTRLTELAFSRAAAKPLLLAIRHHLKPGARCLDFGAGSGHLIDALLESGLQAAAYEPSGRSETIRANFAHRQGFLGVVGRDNPGDFDVVFAAEVIEHVLDSDFEATVEAMAQSLRPGGLIVVTTPNNEDLPLNGCICPTCATLFHRWQHVRAMTTESVEAVLRRHGIEPIVTHVLDFNPAQYAALEALDAGAPEETIVDFLRDIRKDRPVRIGTESSILCLGRRTR